MARVVLSAGGGVEPSAHFIFRAGVDQADLDLWITATFAGGSLAGRGSADELGERSSFLRFLLVRTSCLSRTSYSVVCLVMVPNRFFSSFSPSCVGFLP